ncbi:hypothetical protein FNU76_17065 [Chitinimonas arctica]|uniref:HTH cro/C1-type domain-containing protein n=1 Tax=Chitinimonas arctica TaxID=2594795 RepID=A0A516SID5_9NEIS|nr:helix-turn-helix domain-containing protein [Chitinimonas arctica]QDQ27915.1 hypothetical protein FNU76_17065 [Chitinimonas arctica]
MQQHKNGSMLTPPKIAANIKRILTLFEPDPARQVSALAAMLGVDRTVAYRHLTRGPAKIEMLGRIAGALGVSVAALWDEETEATTVVVAKIAVSGVSIDCIAWLDPTLHTPLNAHELLAWEHDGVWQVDRFRNRREPGFPLRRVEMQCRQISRDSCRVTIYSDCDPVFARNLAAGLASHGYDTKRPLELTDLLAASQKQAPDILILLSRHAEQFARQIDEYLGQVVQTVIICDDNPPPHDPVNGRFFSSKDVVRILILLRQMASGPPLKQTSQEY